MFCFDNCEFEGKVPNTDVMLQCGKDTDDDKSCPFRSWLHVSCLRARGEEPALTESAPVYICEYCRYFKDITELTDELDIQLEEFQQNHTSCVLPDYMAPWQDS